MNFVYDYIAESNPFIANRIIESFGYHRTQNSQGLGKDLEILVGQEGEPAFKAIMEHHPDKEVILELFSDKKTKAKKCTTCQSNSAYLNATGGNAAAATHASVLGNQAGLFIVAASLMLAVAIITKK